MADVALCTGIVLIIIGILLILWGSAPSDTKKKYRYRTSGKDPITLAVERQYGLSWLKKDLLLYIDGKSLDRVYREEKRLKTNKYYNIYANQDNLDDLLPLNREEIPFDDNDSRSKEMVRLYAILKYYLVKEGWDYDEVSEFYPTHRDYYETVAEILDQFPENVVLERDSR